MKYLLDTNIVSETRRARPHCAVLAWLASVPAHRLAISSVTLGEIQAGIELTRQQDQAKAAELEAWLERLARSSEIVSMDGEAFRRWAQLMHRRPRGLSEDAMIAATALVNGFIVATRNVRDFEQFEVEVINPFEFAD